MLDFILGIGELLVSWRLYVGLAVTAAICWVVVALVPSRSLQLALCIPVVIGGVKASWRWQVRADFGK
jgi:hypothetical protein